MDYDVSSSSNSYKQPKYADKTAGRWTDEEHKLFLLGVIKFGRNWKKIEQIINTRSGAQIRSHAQKYFKKVGKFSEQYGNMPSGVEISIHDQHMKEPQIPAQSSQSASPSTVCSAQKVGLKVKEEEIVQNLIEEKSYLPEQILSQPHEIAKKAHNYIFDPLFSEKDFPKSFFSQHIFATAGKTLSTNFYQQYVEYQEASSKDTLRKMGDQSKDTIKKISFRPYICDKKEEGNKIPVYQMRILLPMRF